MRRTYASLRSALHDDPFYIAEQLGHANPAFTFRVYHKAAKRREKLSGATWQRSIAPSIGHSSAAKRQKKAESPLRRRSRSFTPQTHNPRIPHQQAINRDTRAVSSVGRAPALQAGGR